MNSLRRLPGETVLFADGYGVYGLRGQGTETLLTAIYLSRSY
ncbi:MAG TPA: hypothetical protein VGH38_03650 [Bryobacteraceae bacterium]